MWLVILILLVLIIIGVAIYFSIKAQDPQSSLSQISSPAPAPLPSSTQMDEAPFEITIEGQISELRRLLALYNEDLTTLKKEMEEKRIALNRARHQFTGQNEPITLGSRGQVTDAVLTKRLAEANAVQGLITELEAESAILRERLNELLARQEQETTKKIEKEN